MYTKILLGYFGFLPFAFLTITPWIFGEAWEESSFKLLALYGGIIISFLAGIIWGLESRTSSDLFTSIFFSISGFLIILVTFFSVLLALTLSFVIFALFYFFEQKVNPQFNEPEYKKLRRNLTSGVCGCFLFSIVIGLLDSSSSPSSMLVRLVLSLSFIIFFLVIKIIVFSSK